MPSASNTDSRKAAEQGFFGRIAVLGFVSR
jgi:hypothetical protein